MSRRRRQVFTEGWDAIVNVVPGDVVDALGKLGLEVIRLDESGEATVRCPAHLEYVGREDRHPSYSVNINTGLHGCWSCGFRGTFADLVEYVSKCSREEAVAWIRAQGTIKRVERMLAKKATPEVDTTKIVNEASMALFVDPPDWALRERGLTAEACARYGVLWDTSREAWILPVRDETGTLMGWQAKGSGWFENHPPKLKKSHTLFGLWALPPRCERIILVESPLDAVLIASAGLEWALASYGASISDAQMRLILERTDHLVHFPDNDSPGRKAAVDTSARWRGRGLGYSIVDYRPIEAERGWLEGFDPGNFSRRSLRYLVNSCAVPALLYRP
ncbi:toprim domain-containing protein [Microbispora sp. NPDC049633]|uniref:toprim domain-containing protein n=1 Tax=Microbispora sp. NPDC049633 TaxID=3154355 RepID=UPI0034365906